jgi:phage tail-like protein
MSNGHRDDPYGSYNFLVELDSEPVAGFSEIGSLDTETEIIEYRNGTDRINAVRKLPGLDKYANITLKRGFTADRTLWDWRQAVLDGDLSRKTVTIKLLDHGRQVRARLVCEECWPSRWRGPWLAAAEGGAAIELVELAVESFRLTSD